jgi:phosphatidylglycerophosphatase A
MPKPKILFGILPNHLSYFRMVVALVIPALIFSAHPWMHVAAAVTFFFGAISDYFDGWLARRYEMVSDTGKWLDPLADKVLVLTCLWAFSRDNLILYHWFFVAVLVREVIVTFCRTGWTLEGHVFGAEQAGKWKLFFQTLLIGVAFAVLFLGDGYLSVELTNKLQRIGDFVVAGISVIVLVLTWYSGIIFLLNHREFFGTHFFSKYFLAAGVGLLPLAPGTWGSMLGVLLVAAFQFSFYSYLVSFLVIGCAGYYFYERSKGEFTKDPSFFVLDEVCGIFITFMLIGVPWKTFLPGFLLFRLFDIWKPFPIRKLENMPGFWGIMADDLLAGVYAAIVLWLLPL